MGLTNELAEVYEKVDNAAEAKEIVKEIGDVLWYVAMIRQELDLPELEFPEIILKLNDEDVYRLSPSYLLQQVGIISGHVKKFFRDDDYKAGFPEKEKRHVTRLWNKFYKDYRTLPFTLKEIKVTIL